MKGQIFEKQTGKFDPRTMILTLREYEEAILELEPFASGVVTTGMEKNKILKKFVDLAKQIRERK